MKRLITAVLVAAFVLGMVGCGAGTDQSAPTAVTVAQTETYTPGTYSASKQGMGGQVPVSVTFTTDKIESVVIGSNNETPGIGTPVLETFPQLIVEGQTLNIDTIAGATLTSVAVIDAVADTVTQAGGDAEALRTKPKSAKEADGASSAASTEELSTDVLVIGMGASGTMAALNAAEQGADVIGIEATQMLGGMGNAAQGMFAIGTSLQEERYGKDMSAEEEYWFSKIMEATNYLGNGTLIRQFVKESKNTVEYLLDHGIAVYLSSQPQQIAHFDETIIYHRWNNARPFEKLAQDLEKENVRVLFDTRGTSLLVDEAGTVVGARATKKDGTELIVHAKAVIVSTGGFAGNEGMMREVLGDAVYDRVSLIGGTDGIGIQMMYDAGADQTGSKLTMNHGVGTKTAGIEVAEQLTLNTPILWVNSFGKRFMNEDLLTDTVQFSSAVLAQGGYAYTIVDQATVDRWSDSSYDTTGSWVHYWDRFGIIDENGERTIYHAPVDKATFLSDFKKLEASGDGAVVDSLADVAAFIGCDPKTLETTVKNYNSYVKTGYDREYFKSKESLLWTVEKGPFYITKGYNAVLGALGGVKTTEKLEVVNGNGKIIPGLYATGNNVSDVSVASYVPVEGVGLGFALTSGRLAGIASAEYAAQE